MPLLYSLAFELAVVASRPPASPSLRVRRAVPTDRVPQPLLLIILYCLRATRGVYYSISQMPDRRWQSPEFLETAARKWVLVSTCASLLESGWMLYRNLDVGIWTLFSDSSLQLAFGNSNFLADSLVVFVEWALICTLGWVCNVSSNWMTSIARMVADQQVTATLDNYYLLRHNHAESLRCFLHGHFLSWVLLWYIVAWAWIFLNLTKALDIDLGGINIGNECKLMSGYG